MFRLLRDRDFIDPDSRLLLLFIGDRNEHSEWNALIDKEVEFCQRSPKSTAKSALHADGLEIARTAEYASTTWNDLMSFNNAYLATLDPSVQQVEQKLIWGFNETLAGKKFMQRGST